jgi:replicative DNA helicase
MNLTLAIDEQLLKAARRLAAEQDKTVNQMVREYLEQLVSDRRKIAREKLLELMNTSGFEVGPITWAREELYERGNKPRVR